MVNTLTFRPLPARQGKGSEFMDEKKKQHPIRIVVNDALYERLKQECSDHGDVSKLVRKLLTKYLDMMEGTK